MERGGRFCICYFTYIWLIAIYDIVYVYVILHQVVYKPVYGFLNVLYFVGGKYDFNNIGSNYVFII